jgi:hypothetical protein
VSDDNALHEKPLEFFTGGGASGSCDGQLIVPQGDHYRCHCSCGGWDITTSDSVEGLRLARLHTGTLAR